MLASLRYLKVEADFDPSLQNQTICPLPTSLNAEQNVVLILLSPLVPSLTGCRVQAGSDCGFATFGKLPTVYPDIAWAKLGAMAEGAALAAEMV